MFKDYLDLFAILTSSLSLLVRKMLYGVCSSIVEKVSSPIHPLFLSSASGEGVAVLNLTLWSQEEKLNNARDHSSSPKNKGVGIERG